MEFKGLALTTGTTWSVIDGNPNVDNFHYAIGSTQYWIKEDAIAGPFCTVSGSMIPVKTLDLWLKYNKLSVIRKLPGLENYKTEMISDMIDYSELKLLCYLIGFTSIYIDS